MRRRRDTGSFSIEASVVLLAGMLIFGLFASFVSRIRAETAVHTALEKTAAEIASLTYPAARVCEALSHAGDDEENGSRSLSSAVGSFAGMIGIGSDLPSFESMFKDLKSSIGGVLSGESVAAGSEKLYSAIKEIADDPKGAAALLASGALGDLSLDLAGRIIAAPLCRMIMPVYIDPVDADARLEKLGIKGGMDGMDFSLSDVLFNGKDITLVAVYEISPPDFGLPLPARKTVQRAVAAAWVPDSLLNQTASSIWDLSPLERGREIVKKFKTASPGLSVKSGYGFSLYSSAGPVYTLFTSLNPFGAYYSECAETSPGEYSYTLRESNIRRELSDRASSLRRSVDKLSAGSDIKFENGSSQPAVKAGASVVLTVVFPEETAAFSDRIDAVCREVSLKKNVKITVIYYDKALRRSDK